MKVVTASEMREIDRKTIEEVGIPSMVLMERAGLSVVRRIMDNCTATEPVVVLSGGGNNGGDGLVIARELQRAGYNVRVFLLSPEDRLSKDCNNQYEILRKLGLKVMINRTPSGRDLKGSIVVDAIIGTGLNKPLRDKLSKIVRLVNQYASYVVAVDIPTGISSDTGRVMGEAIRADMTVTFGLPKIGHLLPPGSEYTGELFVEDIGFPPDFTNSESLKVELVEEDTIKALLPCRERDSHKGDYGHILIVGGSVGKTGAPLMAARAALKSGAGLVTIALPDAAAKALMGSLLEEMMLPLPSNEDGTISMKALESIMEFLHGRADVVAIGPGLGRNPDTWQLVRELVRLSPLPMVIDADGLNALAATGYEELKRLFSRAVSPAVFTPHMGEMARLVGHSTEELRASRLDISGSFSEETGVVLVLKGAPTVISTPEGKQYINSTGNPGMATAGTGDVLTGIIASLTGQNLSPADASIAGAYIHGLSGDIAAQHLTEYSLTAGDLINYLPEAFRVLSI
ncbi:MAG: NAD(P)H-hydrate dehydratase [Nitrospirae bacterium]|nr:NAD(P)H-hydrate dehydratase [Nitrospirota bacterium]